MSRMSLISLNLWNTEHLESRMPALTSFLTTYATDIFCFQEIRPVLCVLFDKILPGYTRVKGAESGWTQEDTIYFNSSLFAELEHGWVDLHMPEPMRGLFWVRLKTPDGKRLVIATVHFTHQLNADENRTGMPYRPAEARTVAKILPEVASGDGIILAGDFNDPVQPTRILCEEGGFSDVFRLLSVPAPCTFPCLFLTDEEWLVEGIDKIMVRNGVKPLMASSPHFHLPGSVLSDHWPVMGMFEY
ncbi:MAG: endonuclease/exonuclease/phosphatase family protein [Sphaerochaetaceae bacterium]